MDSPEDLITDKAIDVAFGNANFGSSNTKREIIANSLLKCACGYATGHTAKCILEDLELITRKYQLTTIGKAYLWAAYSNRLSL